MKRLFLASLFKAVTDPFLAFFGDRPHGKRVAFIPDAAYADKLYFHVRHSKRLLTRLGFSVDELVLGSASGPQVERCLKECDLLYVGGGNTFYLLQALRRTGADAGIRAQIALGKPFVGESAGAMILAPDIEYASAMDNRSAAPDLADTAGLHVVDFYPLPHFKSFPLAKAADRIIADYAAAVHLVPIRDAQAIVVDGDAARIV